MCLKIRVLISTLLSQGEPSMCQYMKLTQHGAHRPWEPNILGPATTSP